MSPNQRLLVALGCGLVVMLAVLIGLTLNWRRYDRMELAPTELIYVWDGEALHVALNGAPVTRQTRLESGKPMTLIFYVAPDSPCWVGERVKRLDGSVWRTDRCENGEASSTRLWPPGITLWPPAE